MVGESGNPRSQWRRQAFLRKCEGGSVKWEAGKDECYLFPSHNHRIEYGVTGIPATLNSPEEQHLSEEQWALAIALVSGGSTLGAWFNSTVRNRLSIDSTTQERIREAIKNSFYPREDGVFFHEGMSDEEHKSAIERMFGYTPS
jgi:hypothetical protein